MQSTIESTSIAITWSEAAGVLLTATMTALPTEVTAEATVAVTVAAVPTLLSGPLITEVNGWPNPWS